MCQSDAARNKRLNVVFVALGEEIVVELYTFGVDFAGTVAGKMRLHAMERRMPLMPNSSHSSRSTGTGCRSPEGDREKRPHGLQEVVPGNLAHTVSAGLALYLVGSSGAAKDKVLWKLRRRVGDASRINGHDDPIV